MVMVCSVFVASHFPESSQKQDQTAAPVSLTDIIEKNMLRSREGNASAGIDEFIMTFKEMHKCLQVSHRVLKSVLSKCSAICANFQTSLKIYNKFDSVWSKLALRDSSIDKACCEKLKRIAWLSYLLAKESILEKQVELKLAEHQSQGAQPIV